MQRRKDNLTPGKMLSFASSPIFSGSWDHRPTVSSPLSSSPVRAPSPLSQIDENTRYHRHIQSSPIKPIKFKYASKPTRPNPVVRRREDVQDQRRRNFLQNVRHKADNKVWQRRDIEGQFLKTNWLANIGRLTHDAPSFSEADIEDAMAFQEETSQTPAEDGMMADEFGGEEDFELMIASYEEQQATTSHQPSLPPLPENDDEYDDIFAELISQERSSQNQPPDSSNQMDMD